MNIKKKKKKTNKGYSMLYNNKHWYLCILRPKLKFENTRRYSL